uniref:NADH-ubiquinone oxidoreductase chain 2 n=1 Tax=Deflorita sp. ZJZ-2017 TaxID=1945539 RepID=A0A1Q1MP94_9ORTH|nr:NADH dehydrogenase subunit 2 [Deflorita sp. ZJZ-2017]
MPSKDTLFLILLATGTLITISSSSWFGAWMGLELNLLSFIPLMSNTRNTFSTEASLKYFLVQSIASMVLFFSIILMYIIESSLTYLHCLPLFLMSSSLFLKMGAAPFHFWFPSIMEGSTWKNCFILMTWQKIAPFVLLSYVIPMSKFLIIMIITSITVGSIGGLNQTSLRKIMAYSSITHTGWMLASMNAGDNIWLIYFIIYSFLTASMTFLFYYYNLSRINQSFLFTMDPMMKFNLFLLILSLGGLPPFLGFLPKWLVIQSLVMTNQFFLVTIMVITTLITLLYYWNMLWGTYLLSNYKQKNNYNQRTVSPQPFLITLITYSNLGLSLCAMISCLM